MKHLKTISASILATTCLMASAAQAAEFDMSSLTYSVYGTNGSYWYPAHCRININILTKAHPYGRDLPSNYDYFKVKAVDGNGAELGFRTGARYGTYANPRWITWRGTIYAYGTPNSKAPLTLQFMDTNYDRNDDILQDEVELDQQLLLDAGGGCAEIAQATNTPPVSMAGEDLTHALPNHVYSLDGTASFDDDGDELTYSWTQIEGPDVTLDDPTSPTPSFIYPPGPAHQVLTFELMVNDGTEDAEFTDTVSVIHNGRSNGKNAPEDE